MVIYEKPRISKTLEGLMENMNEREKIVRRLSDVTIGGGSHESLSTIAKAILPGVKCWTINDCDHLRRFLVDLISRNNDEYDRGFDEGFASADDVLAKNEAALEAHGFYRMPFEPGDDVEHDDGRRGVVKRVSVQLSGETAIKSALVAWGGDKGTLWTDAKELHLYHKPTVIGTLAQLVEDYTEIINEYICSEMSREERADSVAQLVAKYATKFRLAKEGE